MMLTASMMVFTRLTSSCRASIEGTTPQFQRASRVKILWDLRRMNDSPQLQMAQSTARWELASATTRTVTVYTGDG